MKKILMLMSAAALSLCVAMPATAKVHVGGLVALDFYYHRVTSTDNPLGGITPGTDDWQQLEIEVPGHSRMNAKWVTDDSDVGMFIELGLGGPNGATGVTLRHAYGWWQIHPMFKLLAGHTDGSFATLNPGQVLGMNAFPPPGLHIIGIGFGNLYEGRIPQLRLETTFNDMITWKIAAADNRAIDDDIWGNEENVWPRVDTMLALNFGPLYVEPGFSWSKGKHDEGSQGIGAATSFNVFAFALGFKFGFGPFSLAGEGVYGRNMANAPGWAAFTFAAVVPVAVWGPEYDNQFDLENSEDIAFWLDAAFKVGPADIHLIYGYQNTEGFLTWYDGSDWREGEVQWTRQMLGISVPITVAKIFIIRPELFWYDWGEWDFDDDYLSWFNTTLPPGAPSFRDLPFGDEIVGGVAFTVIF
ncbi:hypothetical protein ACFL2O_02330 [Thermodesulfobacteriota bacterium]